MSLTKLAYGIFTWDGYERRSQRYGTFVVDGTDYNQNTILIKFVDETKLNLLDGKRVRLVAKVVENRGSGHMGDRFLNLFPSKPDVGESIEIGIGTLFTGVGFNGNPAIGLKPSDGREDLWLDPRKLYRLHDQTVEIFVEETEEGDLPKAELESREEGAIANGDGSVQVFNHKAIKEDIGVKIIPTVKNLGDGLFVVETPREAGERVNVKFV